MAIDKSRKTMFILFIGLSVCVVGLAVYLFATQFGNGSPYGPDDESSVSVELPDGEAQDISDSKSDAYRGKVSTEEYFEGLGARLDSEDGDFSLVSQDNPPEGAGPKPARQKEGSTAAERVFGPVPSSSVSPPGGGGKRSSSGGTTALSMTAEEKLDYDRKRAEMVRDVLSGEETPQSAESTTEVQPVQMIDLSSQNSADSIITTLDDDGTAPDVNYGEGIKKPFRCMFVRDQKLTSGERVTLRLLEDYNSDGIHIPANTHLRAICKIADRLELQVRSLEMNGRIVPLSLDAYDTDGIMGIYCPETTASKNSRKARNDAITTAGTTFGGLVGDLASTVIRTGASIARSASGELSVTVISGYEFYLVKFDKK